MSTGLSKFGACGLESRTKSPKIGKMFYSVTFAKAVRSQITGKSTANQKSPFCSQHNSSTVIEQQLPCSTAFGKITAVYGQIDENRRFVRKWTVPKMAITDKMVKNPCLSVKFERNLGAPPRIRKNPCHHWHGFQIIVQLWRSASHLVLIGFRLTTPCPKHPCSGKTSLPVASATWIRGG